MSKIAIIEAIDRKHIEAVEHLLRDYLLWMRRRYRGRNEMVDAYFDKTDWESELADLDTRYGAPYGAVVLALVDGVPAGCVVLHGIGARVSEMKRLFVRPAFRGLGLARRMIDFLMQLSCSRGYSHMRFETGALQSEAATLYRNMGFKAIPPYYACSDLQRQNGRFFEAQPSADRGHRRDQATSAGDLTP